MQNTLVHIHKDISLPFYIYLYLCTALSLLKWYPVVDFFFQFYFSTLLTLITKGLDKELLSPPPSMHIVYLQFLQLCIFKIMWGLRLREGGTKVVWEGGVLVKLPLKTFSSHYSYTEMKTNALFSNKSFPAISSASRRQYRH